MTPKELKKQQQKDTGKEGMVGRRKGRGKRKLKEQDRKLIQEDFRTIEEEGCVTERRERGEEVKMPRIKTEYKKNIDI